jgi:hypothetical protein
MEGETKSMGKSRGRVRNVVGIEKFYCIVRVLLGGEVQNCVKAQAADKWEIDVDREA